MTSRLGRFKLTRLIFRVDSVIFRSTRCNFQFGPVHFSIWLGAFQVDPVVSNRLGELRCFRVDLVLMLTPCTYSRYIMEIIQRLSNIFKSISNSTFYRYLFYKKLNQCLNYCLIIFNVNISTLYLGCKVLLKNCTRLFSVCLG